LAHVFRALVDNKGDHADLVDWELKTKMEELVQKLYEIDPIGIKSDWTVKSKKNNNNKENVIFLTEKNNETKGQKK